MGLLSFIKSAGKKLLGGSKPSAPAAPQESQADRDRRFAKALYDEVKAHGFEIADPAIRYSGGTVAVAGTVDTQEVREKVVLTLGNVEGVEAVDDNLEVKEKEPEAVFYTVVSGDTLSKIAKQHYGNAMKYPVIFEANKPMLTDPDKIYPGQVLRIPPQ